MKWEQMRLRKPVGDWGNYSNINKRTSTLGVVMEPTNKVKTIKYAFLMNVPITMINTNHFKNWQKLIYSAMAFRNGISF